jgi:Outer membrane protein beta-barrel domain
MKKVLCLSALLSLALQLMAQDQKQPPDSSASLVFGIEAGANFSYASTESFGDKNNSERLANLQGGVFSNINLGNGFYLQPLLEYVGKGGDKTEATLSGDAWMAYAELPVDVLYRPKIGMKHLFFFGAGPYIAYGVAGQLQDNASSSDVYNVFQDNPQPNTPAFLKRIDAGANLQAGVNFAKHFQFNIDGDFGLMNILNYRESSGDHFRNTAFGATIGYLFKHS